MRVEGWFRSVWAVRGAGTLTGIVGGLVAVTLWPATAVDRVDRVDALGALLEELCAPYVLGRREAVRTDDLLHLTSHMPGEVWWFDERARLAVVVEPARCSVTDVFEPLVEPDHGRAITETIAIAEAAIPSGTFEDNSLENGARILGVLVARNRTRHPAFTIAQWDPESDDIFMRRTTFTFGRASEPGVDL